MVNWWAFALVLFFVAPGSGESAERIEYGERRELASIRSIAITSAGNPELADAAAEYLAQELPALSLTERGQRADVTLELARQLRNSTETEGPPSVVTTARIIRRTRGATLLFADGTSDAEHVSDAVAEALRPFAVLLRSVNPERFGADGAGATRSGAVQTTEGLRAGMTRFQVRQAIGRPLKRDRGHSFTETWTYATTRGTMRLVFGGDRLRSIVFEKTE